MLIQIVSSERIYGGPEEGGWWYDWTTVLFTKRTTKRLAKKLLKQLIVEVQEEYPSREIELLLPISNECREHGSCRKCEPKLIKRAYRGRNRFSVLGGEDLQIRMGKRFVEGTKRGERYE